MLLALAKRIFGCYCFLWPVRRRAAILTCEKCGAEIQEGASFCPQCASPVSVSSNRTRICSAKRRKPPEVIPALPQGCRRYHERFQFTRDSGCVPQRIFARHDPYFRGIRVGGAVLTRMRSSEVPRFTMAISLTSLPQLTLLAIGLTILVAWLYYAFFEDLGLAGDSRWQKNKKASVRNRFERAANYASLRATMRHFGKMISGLTFLVGYFLAGFTEKKQALHDMHRELPGASAAARCGVTPGASVFWFGFLRRFLAQIQT